MGRPNLPACVKLLGQVGGSLGVRGAAFFGYAGAAALASSMLPTEHLRKTLQVHQPLKGKGATDAGFIRAFQEDIC